MREEYRVGHDFLNATTQLLQRVRSAHPTKGLYEAAELQWWWGVPRPSDELDQLFWLDDDDRLAAAVIIADFTDGGSALYTAPTVVFVVMPDATTEWVAHVVDRGLAHAQGFGFPTVELEVDRADEVMRKILFDRGFTVEEDGYVECWVDAADRSEVSALHEDYRLFSRGETLDRVHHMADPRRPNIEARLQETSLYRPDLDLVVFDADDNVAGYGMFWYDPETATGVVEPMRTNDDHQKRGIARHILTEGVDRLARAGAERISIGYAPDNPASGPLYRSVGFEPHRQTDLFTGPTQQAE